MLLVLGAYRKIQVFDHGAPLGINKTPRKGIILNWEKRKKSKQMLFIDDGVSSSSSMLSSSRLVSDTFSQASPREQVHREEHIRPAFRQPQEFLHPFLQFQDIIFKRDSGAASLSILRGCVGRGPIR
ncbi:hypothetical protein AVEN_153786-1 [Araneus ventricosus]|uniref:Uncharacterized protein n=1 Tax=Araneus ventricosus TaxID=182803 RepID=A0A4Y2KEB9_ARAVE|nr:hypothetical protein AVEN_153786-1 [Araneus ventricosus]